MDLYARFKKSLQVKDAKKLYLYCFIVGIISGLGAVLFSYGIAYCQYWFYEVFCGVKLLHPPGGFYITSAGEITPNRLLFFFLPAAGGLLSGFLVFVFAPEAKGHGTDALIDAFHQKEGKIRARVPLIKSLATILTIASGGSAGREGPVAQIGGGIGSSLAQFCGLGPRARRSLLLAGTAGGLGAIFHAPLGGALTAVEVIYQEDIESDSLIPCLISSVVAYLIYSYFMGFKHLFGSNQLSFNNVGSLFYYAILGFVCFGFGWIYVKVFYGFRDYFFDKLPLHRVLVPVVGGLLVGSIGYFFPQVLGMGFGYVEEAISGNIEGNWLSLSCLFLVVAIMKTLATSFTISSGSSGGVFGPSLFVGAMLGGFVGTISHHFHPEIVPSIGPFIVVGMGAFFAGVAHAPIASLIMICELTGNYELLPPMMVVSVIALIFPHSWSIYEKQVKNCFSSPAHTWDMNVDVLKSVTIAEAFSSRYHKKAIVSHEMLFYSLEDLSEKTHETDFVVNNKEGEYVGIISLRHIPIRESNELIRNLLLMADVVEQDVPPVGPEDNLHAALEIIMRSDVDKLAVVKEKRLLGYIQYKDIFAAYHRMVDRSEG